MSEATDVFPPVGPVTLQQVIKSYLYAQYTDDDNLQTFVLAQNYLAQKWLDDFNDLNLPVWSALSGSLLDWIGWGLYGIRRPILSYQKPAPSGAGSGPYNTMPYDTSVYGGGRLHPANTNPVTYLTVNDDVYKRILTWHLYRGDGFQFSTPWLKRRIHRFLRGDNGYLSPEDEHYDVSVTTTGPAAVSITITNQEIGTVFQYAVIDGVLALPFQIAFTVNTTVVSFPNGATGHVFGSAAISGNLDWFAGLPGVETDAVGGMSGAIAVLRGNQMLAGETDALAGIAGNALRLPAAGGVLWPVTGRLDGAGGIGGVAGLTAGLSGVLPGTAG